MTPERMSCHGKVTSPTPKFWESKKPNNIQISKTFGPEAFHGHVASKRRSWPAKHLRFRQAASSLGPCTSGKPKQIEHANGGHENGGHFESKRQKFLKMYLPQKTQHKEEGGVPQLSTFPQRQCPKNWDSVTLGEKKVPHEMILTYHEAEMSSSLAEKHCHKRNAGLSVLFLVASVELNSSISHP